MIPSFWEDDDDEFEMMSDDEVREMFGQGKGKGSSTKNLYAYGRVFDDWDDEAGWGEDFKRTAKEFKADMPRYEKDTPLIQRFIDGREFIEGFNLDDEDDMKEKVLSGS